MNHECTYFIRAAIQVLRTVCGYLEDIMQKLRLEEGRAGMNHSFDIEHARLYGIPEAVIISNLQFWITRNKANGENFRDGRTWTYNSVKAFAELFPYMTTNQIRRSLERLVEFGVLIAGNYNASTYDRTKWFAFSDESIFLNPQIHLADLPNGSGKRAKTVKTDITTGENPNSVARATRLPADWVLPKSWGETAMELQPTWTPEHVRFEADKFKDYWVSKSGKDATKTDWLATWRNWCRNAGPMNAGVKGGGSWWATPEAMLAKAIEVGVGEAIRGESKDAWKARIQEAIDNGGKPPVQKPKPAIKVRESVDRTDRDNKGEGGSAIPQELRKTILKTVGLGRRVGKERTSDFDEKRDGARSAGREQDGRDL